MSKAASWLTPLGLCVLSLVLSALLAACVSDSPPDSPSTTTTTATDSPTAAATVPPTATPKPSSGPESSEMDDRKTLVAFYNATGGENVWSVNENWLTDAPLAEWYGVTTDDNGRVTELTLTGNRLSGGDTGGVGQPRQSSEPAPQREPV